MQEHIPVLTLLGYSKLFPNLCFSGLNPVLAADVVEFQNVAERPVKVVSDRGYLLLQAMGGVA